MRKKKSKKKTESILLLLIISLITISSIKIDLNKTQKNNEEHQYNILGDSYGHWDPPINKSVGDYY